MYADVPTGASQIGRLSYPLLQALRMILTNLSASWNVEHTESGTHGAITCSSISERDRSVAMGVWTTVPVMAADFLAQAGTWTVDAADVLNYQYMLVGTTMFFNGWFTTTSLSAGPTYLTVTIPGGYKTVQETQGACQLVDNGTYAAGSAFVLGGYGTTVTIARADNAALAASANNTAVRFSIAFEVA